eukprot:g2193.t1
MFELAHSTMATKENAATEKGGREDGHAEMRVNLAHVVEEAEAGTKGRLYDRSFPDFQSSGKANITRRGGLSWSFKLWYDWYHSVANLPTRWATLIACILYVAVNTVFACVWWGMSSDGDPCNIGATSFSSAFYFSLITLSTIGYGNQDLYFDGCAGPTIVITLETLVGLLLDAGIFALLILKYSRGRPRGFSMLFSRYAVVRFINGVPYFSFRVVERRKHQLVEAHVRVYAIRHERDPETGTVAYFQQFYMRLQKPDDELGGMLLPVLPTEVVHRVDAWSPLMPPAPASSDRTPINSYRFPEILQRQADADAGSRDQYECPVCGESYIAESNFLRHVRYCKFDDTVSGHDKTTSCEVCGESYPSREILAVHKRFCCSDDADGSHRPPSKTAKDAAPVSVHTKGMSHIALAVAKDATVETPEKQSERMRKFMLDTNVEIVAIVEGICPITSCTLQSRHSYHARSGDIVFNHCFAPCTSEDAFGGCVIDYEAFQGVTAVGDDTKRAPPPCSH